MRVTLRKDPFLNMDRIFDENLFNFVEYEDQVQVDVYEENENVFIEVKAPGFDEKSIDVSIHDNVLTVTGKKDKEEEVKERTYYRKEISTQSFTRKISLPVPVKADSVDAKFKNSVLKISFEKSEEASPKMITVKAE
jgi:HSP20 family protein